MINRLLTLPNQSFFLLGPRGTGKSTWLKACFPHALTVDLLNPATQFEYTTHPEFLYSVVRSLPDQADIIVDEIQKVPDILSVVHGLIEENKGWRFILTGSSARKLRRGGVDLLAGRAILRTMHPFIALELGDAFSLDHALTYGMVPSIIMSNNPSESLKSYVAIYLNEEVKAESLVRNLTTFSRFLEILSFSHASQINAAAIGRDCGVDRKTVELWTQILQDLLIGSELKPFVKRAARKLVSHPKFYFFDCGVFRSVRPKGPLDRPAEIDGAALEGLVLQHLLAWITFGYTDTVTYFWRSQSGTEVDFVLYGESIFTAIEVKNTGQVRQQDLKGLIAFKADYPECGRLLLLYRGMQHLYIDGVLCLPCDTFLRHLHPLHTIEQIVEGIKKQNGNEGSSKQRAIHPG
ncbi:ATP-binding protein [bacterium]|nr:ATP-binding protein [candidate division CSSED10-310 bacterium]